MFSDPGYVTLWGRVPEASLANTKVRLNTVLTKTLCYKKKYIVCQKQGYQRVNIP